MLHSNIDKITLLNMAKEIDRLEDEFFTFRDRLQAIDYKLYVYAFSKTFDIMQNLSDLSSQIRQYVFAYDNCDVKFLRQLDKEYRSNNTLTPF